MATSFHSPPLVERTRELGLLDTALAHAADGASRLALVTGEAGIGKSRLLAEFVTTRAPHGVVQLGAGTPGATGVPFIDLLARPPAVAPDAATTLGSALAAVLSERARDGCVVAVIEDVQWVDPVTIDAVSHALRRLEGMRVMKIGRA